MSPDGTLSALTALLADTQVDHRRALGQACELLAEATQDGIALDILSRDRRLMVAVAVAHPEPGLRKAFQSILGERFPADEGFTAAALDSGSPLFIPRVTPVEIRGLQPAIAPFCEAIGMKGFIVLPLTGRSTSGAVLWQVRTRPEPALTLEDQTFLQEAGSVLGLFVENWQLSDRLSEVKGK